MLRRWSLLQFWTRLRVSFVAAMPPHRHAWVHVFTERVAHQKPQRLLSLHSSTRDRQPGKENASI